MPWPRWPSMVAQPPNPPKPPKASEACSKRLRSSCLFLRSIVPTPLMHGGKSPLSRLFETDFMRWHLRAKCENSAAANRRSKDHAGREGDVPGARMKKARGRAPPGQDARQRDPRTQNLEIIVDARVIVAAVRVEEPANRGLK